MRERESKIEKARNEKQGTKERERGGGGRETARKNGKK